MMNLKILNAICLASSALTLSAGTWTYDPSTATLSDGNWSFYAPVLKGNDIYVRKVTAGAGDLDFGSGVYSSDGTDYTLVQLHTSSFSGNVALTSLVVPPTVHTIRQDCCSDCTALTNVTAVSSGLKVIGYNAFFNCRALSDVTISSAALTEIGSKAFMNAGLKNVILEAPSLEVLNANCFDNSAEVSSMTNDVAQIVPRGVKSVGLNAFYNQKDMTGTLVLTNASLTFAGDFAFGKCQSLKGVRIASASANIWRADNGDKVADEGIKAFDACTGLTTVELRIPNMTFLPGQMFRNCTGLKEVVLDMPRLETIHKYTFYENTSLERIVFENRVNAYAGAAYPKNPPFDGCSTLKSLVFFGEAVEDLSVLKDFFIASQTEDYTHTIYAPRQPSFGWRTKEGLEALTEAERRAAPEGAYATWQGVNACKTWFAHVASPFADHLGMRVIVR